jgi:hypothetical protein
MDQGADSHEVRLMIYCYFELLPLQNFYFLLQEDDPQDEDVRDLHQDVDEDLDIQAVDVDPHVHGIAEADDMEQVGNEDQVGDADNDEQGATPGSMV